MAAKNHSENSKAAAAPNTDDPCTFKEGQLVWAKWMSKWPWFPGVISDEEECADLKTQRKPKRPSYAVMFLPKKDFAWVSVDNLLPYFANRADKENAAVPSDKKKKLQDALAAIRQYVEDNPETKKFEEDFLNSQAEQGSFYPDPAEVPKLKENLKTKEPGSKNKKKKPARKRVPEAEGKEEPVPPGTKEPKLEEAKETKEPARDTVSRVGFIYAGAVGDHIARHLCSLRKTGTEVTLWTLPNQNGGDWKNDADLQENLREVFDADVVFSHFDEEKTISDLVTVLGGGVLRKTPENQMRALVELSTISQSTVLEFKQLLAEAGIKYFQAPIVGDSEKALHGRLCLIFSGNKTVYGKYKAVVESFTSSAIVLGNAETTDALVMKHCLDTIKLGIVASVAEASAMLAQAQLSQNDLSILVRCSGLKELVQDAVSAVDSGDGVVGSLSNSWQELRAARNHADDVQISSSVLAAVGEKIKWALQSRPKTEEVVQALYENTLEKFN